MSTDMTAITKKRLRPPSNRSETASTAAIVAAARGQSGNASGGLRRHDFNGDDLDQLRSAAAPDLQPHAERRRSDDQVARLRQVRRFARLMDGAFSIPGTPIKFGWDSVLGLVPGAGDVVSAVSGGWIIREAYRSGVPTRRLAKMFGNIAVDLLVGVIPIFGDMFDLYWKSNLRNVAVLERHLMELNRRE